MAQFGAGAYKLYQVPYINSGLQPWPDDEVHFMAQLGPWLNTRYGAGKRS